MWKKIAHFPVDAVEYERSIDVHLSSYNAMLTMDAETFEFSFEDLMFQVQLADGSSRELQPGGATKAVTVENRAEFVQLVVDARLHEIDLGLEVVEDGVERAALREAAVVPRVRRVAARDGPADARPLAELEKSLRAEAGLLGQAALREREKRECVRERMRKDAAK